MYVLTVLPIKKALKKEELSYFSKEAVEIGSIIKVPIRGKTYSAIVTACESAENLKAEIKSSAFALRKAGSFESKFFFGESWNRTVKKSGEYFAAASGEMLSTLIPALVLENIGNIKPKKRLAGEHPSGHAEILAHQAEESERVLNYKRAVREAFAKGHSVFIALPTNQSIVDIKKSLEKGIEEHTYTFFADMPKRDFVKNWKQAIDSERPVLVIGSALWVILPREDFKTIILEKENSSGWKTLSRPFIDLRKFLEIYAAETESKLILGDTVLRIETLADYKGGKIGEFEGVKWRIAPSTAVKQETSLIDMRKPETPGKNYESGFKAVGEELLDLIKLNKHENKNMFIYTVRKGLAPITLCRDCGEEVVCDNCGAPVVLYENREINVFRCHQCGEVRSAQEICKKCGSWRLTALGVGIERVAQEIKEISPEVKVFRIQKEEDSHRSPEETVMKFYESPGSILLGTEMALQYLREPLDYSAIASIDPLFFVPDFRIREKIFRLVLNVKLLAKEACLIQARKAERETLSLALSGNVTDFYKMEMEDREALGYPPFSTFIKITARGSAALATKEAEKMEKMFERWRPTIFPSKAERRAAKAAVNCVIKIPKGQWPDKSLAGLLLSLPPYYEIKVDPENLL